MNLLTTQDAAARLGVTRDRVYQFIREHRLPAQKVGRDYLIDAKDLKLVEDRKTGRPAKQPTKKNSRKQQVTRKK